MHFDVDPARPAAGRGTSMLTGSDPTSHVVSALSARNSTSLRAHRTSRRIHWSESRLGALHSGIAESESAVTCRFPAAADVCWAARVSRFASTDAQICAAFRLKAASTITTTLGPDYDPPCLALACSWVPRCWSDGAEPGIGEGVKERYSGRMCLDDLDASLSSHVTCV